MTVVEKKYAPARAVRSVFNKMTILTELSWKESQMAHLLLFTFPEVEIGEWNSAMGREKNPKKNKNQNLGRRSFGNLGPVSHTYFLMAE